MSSPTSENVNLIKQMGLTDEEAIRNALRQTSNDVDSAISILLPDTDDQGGVPPPGDSYDMEMKVH